MASLKERVVRLAQDLGFDRVRIASAEPFVEHGEAAQERVRQGLLDGMPWFTQERVQRASDPQALLPGARSIVCVALSHLPSDDADDPAFDAPRGKVARYARWVDYHQVMKDRLRALCRGLEQGLGRPVRARVFVDDGPFLERAAAQRAGLGWFGKNTNILTPGYGSWVFLGQVLTDLELEPDEPLKKTCGACDRCIPACPTGAIVAPYVIDAPRCISYLTIECRGAIPRELRPRVGDWVFGCDICQEVCPVNRKALPASGKGEPELKRTGPSSLELSPLLSLTDDQFRQRFRNTPILRAKRVGLQCNACVALGNLGDPVAIPALGRALQGGESLVRSHAAWALGRLGGPQAERLLQRALARETDPEVREEIEAALEELGHPRQGMQEGYNSRKQVSLSRAEGESDYAYH